MTAQPPLFVHVFASFGGGGVPYRIAGFLNWLGADARHLIIALDGDFVAGKALDKGLDVRLEEVDASGNLFSRLGRIRRHLKAEAPDLLLTYNWGSIEWALANRIKSICPHIHFESGFGKEEADRQLRRRVLGRWLALGKTDWLVVPSSALANLIRAQWRFPETRIRLIPNGVNTERFSAAPDMSLFKELETEEAPQIIGSVAPLRPEKNISRLIRSFALIRKDNPKAWLVIAGNGAEREKLEACAQSLNVRERVLFLGHISTPEHLYGAFDVFAMSSDTEQMPNSVLQAMSAGLPVVATDVGDIGQMVCEANRPMITARDDEALAGALKALLDDPSAARQIGEHNRQRAKADFDIQTMYRAYRELMAGVASCEF